MSDLFVRPEHISDFRRIAAVTWDAPRDPTIYGGIEVDVTELDKYLERKREESGVKVTYTHAVARGVGIVLGRYPQLNATIRRGSVYLRRNIDIFLQVAIPTEKEGESLGVDLSGARVRNCDEKDIVQIAQSLQETARRIRKRDDPLLKATKGLLTAVPPFASKRILRLLQWLNHDMDIDLRRIGVPRDPFGSVCVSSVGMFGLKGGYAPLLSSASGIGVVLVSAVHKKPWVVDGDRIEARPILPVSMALDHRVVDGYQGAILANEVGELLHEPDRLDLADGGFAR